jgi:hypothetical protein
MHVKFYPTTKLAELTVPPPKPAKEYLPQWYRDIPAFYGKKPQIEDNGDSNRTVKMCMPFADSFSAGYIQESWQDINIEYTENDEKTFDLRYVFPTEPKIISHREKPSIEIDKSFLNVEFTFHPAWMPKLPPGWSMLYTTPFNRNELPIKFLDGIIDNDGFSYSEKESNMPFLVKSSFSGIIPKGTPLLQMIPIKRESWTSSFEPYDEDEQIRITHQLRQHFWGGYKKLFWNKKEYR